MQKIFNCKIIEFLASDKIILNGILLGSQKNTCILYIHGMNGNFYKNKIPFELSNSKFFSVFSINTRGHDLLSTIKNNKNNISYTAGTYAENFDVSFNDISGAVKLLKQLKFKKIILAGHSTGCQKILNYMITQKNNDIFGLIFLAPADDYSIKKKELREEFQSFLKTASLLKNKKKGNIPSIKLGMFTPNRAISAYSLNKKEANLFYYDGNLKDFSKVKIPILVIFGSKEEYKDRNVKEYISKLKLKTNSKFFKGIIIKNARHSFYRYEKNIRLCIEEWYNEQR